MSPVSNRMDHNDGSINNNNKEDHNPSPVDIECEIFLIMLDYL